MFDPTVFALTEVRGKNLASNTIGNVLRAVMAFQLFLDARDIDLDARLADGELLSLGEIEDPRFDSTMRPLASCGSHGYCGLLKPIACYTCANFEPWLDGPHEAVLEFLIGERDRLSSRGDMRIAAINDRTILAVAEVVRQCDTQRGTDGRNG